MENRSLCPIAGIILMTVLLRTGWCEPANSASCVNCVPCKDEGCAGKISCADTMVCCGPGGSETCVCQSTSEECKNGWTKDESYQCMKGCDLNCREGWTRHGDVCYHHKGGELNMLDALRACELLNATLLRVPSADVNQFVVDQGYGTVWIGVWDQENEGVFVDIQTNEPVTYTNWKDNQPDNFQGAEHCVNMNTAGLWNDFRCRSNIEFVCEYRLEMNMPGSARKP